MIRGVCGGVAGLWASVGSIPGCGFMQCLLSNPLPSWQSRAYPASSIPLPPSGSTSEVPGPSRRLCCEFFFAIYWPELVSRRRLRTPRPCLGRWREAGWRAEVRAPRDLRGRSLPRPTMPPPVTSPLRSQRRGSRASRSLVCRRRASPTSTCTTQVSSSQELTGGWNSLECENVKEYWIWIWKGERASVSQWFFWCLGSRRKTSWTSWQNLLRVNPVEGWKSQKIRLICSTI